MTASLIYRDMERKRPRQRDGETEKWRNTDGVTERWINRKVEKH